MTRSPLRLLILLGAFLLSTAYAPTAAQTEDPCASAESSGHEGHEMASTPEAPGHEGMEMGEAGELPPVDLAFLVLMDPHHEGAIAMSKVALERSERPEIQGLAQSIIDSQTAEQEQLRAWQTAWYADAPEYTEEQYMMAFDAASAELGTPAAEDGMGMMHMDPAADVATLCGATGDFDLAFIDLMISHHQAAVEMANVEIAAGTQPELVAFAEGVIEAQSAEITQMQEWRDAWFVATPAS
jgi:uncharacterized protein (DUF305 family)